MSSCVILGIPNLESLKRAGTAAQVPRRDMLNDAGWAVGSWCSCFIWINPKQAERETSEDAMHIQTVAHVAMMLLC